MKINYKLNTILNIDGISLSIRNFRQIYRVMQRSRFINALMIKIMDRLSYTVMRRKLKYLHLLSLIIPYPHISLTLWTVQFVNYKIILSIYYFFSLDRMMIFSMHQNRYPHVRILGLGGGWFSKCLPHITSD